MNILVPRIRNKQQWQNVQLKRQYKDILEQIQTKKVLTFQKYCTFSQWILDATLDFFNTKSITQFMSNPKIEYGQKNEKAKEQGGKIIAIISYAWDHAFRLIRGMFTSENKNDTLKIYTQENINLQLMRIQKMLKQIRGKRYRFQNFTREISIQQQINQKQCQQQLDLIKLLTTILNTQISKIQHNRKDAKPIQKQLPMFIQKSKRNQKISPQKKISEIIKIDNYFKRKIQRINQQNLQKNFTQHDPISKYEQQRKFNMAAIRYHMITRKM